MDVCLVEVPFHAGDDGHPSSAGPQRLLETGAAELFTERGASVTVFNTPESTSSGFFAGMSTAIVTGHCYRDYWAEIGDNTPLAEDTIVMLGVRDLSPRAERERLQQSAIQAVHWRDGRPDRDILHVLDDLARRTREVYLHIDFDAFAPDLAPGVADEPVAGGLTLAQAETIIGAAVERFRIRAVTLATYTPDRDREERTLRLAHSLIRRLADYAVGR